MMMMMIKLPVVAVVWIQLMMQWKLWGVERLVLWCLTMADDNSTLYQQPYVSQSVSEMHTQI